MEPVPSHPAETSLRPWEQSSCQGRSCEASWEPTRAWHLQLPGTCCPDHPAQVDVKGHLHFSRLKGLEETDLSSAASIVATRDVNTGKQTSYKWMQAVHSYLH